MNFFNWLCTSEGMLVFFLMLLVFSCASAQFAASGLSKEGK